MFEIPACYTASKYNLLVWIIIYDTQGAYFLNSIVRFLLA